jgi:hypothetical protein
MDLGVSDLSTLHLRTMYLGGAPDKHGEPFRTIQSFRRTDHLSQVRPTRRTGTLTLDQKMVGSVHLPMIRHLRHHLINYSKGKRSSDHLGSLPSHSTTSQLPMSEPIYMVVFTRCPLRTNVFPYGTLQGLIGFIVKEHFDKIFYSNGS